MSDAATVTVTVRLFAGFRRAAGVDSFTLELPAGAAVADALVAVRAGRFPGLPARETFAVAVDQVYADDTVALHHGAELALVPPVSGG